MAERNQEVAQLLESIADVLEVKGEQQFRVLAYRDAARRIADLNESVGAIYARGQLQNIPRIGPSLAAKIGEYLETGHSSFYEGLRASVPPSLVELLQVHGLGPSKTREIYSHLGISSLIELADAARTHRLSQVPGIGVKTEDKILREVERLQQRSKRLLISVALPAAEEVARLLREHPAIEQVEPAGSIRRRLETIGDIDLVASSRDPKAAMVAFTSLPIVKEVIWTGPSKTSILTRDNLQIDLRVAEPSVYGSMLHHFTGSKAHNIHLRDIAISKGYRLNEYGLFSQSDGRLVSGASEEEIYESLGIEWMPPEMREDRGEIEAAANGKLPKLITESDLRGDLHVHSNWSDGKGSVEDMVKAALARGWEYMAITDHSQSLGVARGLTVERVREQARLIADLNRKYHPFRVLHGIEAEIRGDGSLDYPAEVLAQFDIVTGSLHTARGQSAERIMGRIATAMSGGYLLVLNHPSGRILNRRPAYAVDLGQTIELASKHNIALEVNGTPDRLDLNDVWTRRAQEAGVLLSLNSDAHGPSQLGFVYWAVATARRGWVKRQDVLNALPLPQLLSRLAGLSRAA
ncbi:MAG: DNA polymerase/3'-5' exonuclease PolX [Chloroflexota bacterium]